MTQQVTLTRPSTAIDVTIDQDQVTVTRPATALAIEVHHLPGAGGAAAGYRHDQLTPTQIWTVTHNLGYRPGGVAVFDSGGTHLLVDPVHVSDNQLTIDLGAATSGAAYIS